jgi:hypothetical protein
MDSEVQESDLNRGLKMETLNTIHHLVSGNRHLTITKGKDSVDIRITKYGRNDPNNVMDEEIIQDDVNIPISMDAYNDLVNEMWKSC